MGMSINAISGISSYSAVCAIKSGSRLSAETIQKLKTLGINPNNIKTEAEAQEIIAQAQNCSYGVQINNFDSNAYSSRVDMHELFSEIKELGAKVGISVSDMQDLEGTVKKIETKINEVEKAGAASNQQNSELRVSLNEIKADLEKLDSKKSAFVSMDVMSALNRFAFGL